MNVDSGTFARGSTGNQTLLMNNAFVPSLIMFYVTGKTSGDTEAHIAIGYWHGSDGTVQASAGKSSETRAKTLSHYAGTTEKLAFTVTGVGSGGTLGEIYINWTAVDANYNVHYIAMA